MSFQSTPASGMVSSGHAIAGIPAMVRTLVLAIAVAGISNSRAVAGEFSEPEAPPDRQAVVVLVGHEGAAEFREPFRTWAQRWEAAAARADAEFHSVGLDPEDADQPDRERASQLLAALPGESSEPLWLVLIGHGTPDGQSARFNFRGPDAGVDDFAAWLDRFSRPVAVINCTSASGPFLSGLARPERVIVTATKSGFEYNFARFGDYMSQAIARPAADLDKDEQTSLLEAFLFASKQVIEFYEQEGRLATEHALLDDNGDGKGTPADWFRGVRAVRRAADDTPVDGFRAGQLCLVRSQREQSLSPTQRSRRDQLERDIRHLRDRKDELGEDAYYEQLEPLFVELATIYAAAQPSSVDGSP